MFTEDHPQITSNTPSASTLGDRMQSAGTGVVSQPEHGTTDEAFAVEEEGIDPPGEGFKLSSTPDQMPALIAGLRWWRGMTHAQLGETIGYSALAIGNIEQGSRKLGIKTLDDLFTALGGELCIEF